jgi:hypothetical protein
MMPGGSERLLPVRISKLSVFASEPRILFLQKYGYEAGSPALGSRQLTYGRGG